MKKPLTETLNHGLKKETEKRKINIPKEFIKKIKRLGMKVEDAEILYKSKIDWCAVYSENKIYCTETGCDYSCKIDDKELRNHTITVHEYGDYPCEYDHCDNVSYSKVIFTIMSRLTLIHESWKKIQNARPSPSVFCGKKIQSPIQHGIIPFILAYAI